MARGFRTIDSRPLVFNLLRFGCGVYGVYVVAAAHRANLGVDTYIRESVVAVLLGWLLAGEALTLRLVMATIAILGAIVLIRKGDQQNGKHAYADQSD
jgi:hypothetical protein